MKPLVLSHVILNNLIPDRFDAINLYFVVLIHTSHKDDKQLTAHEVYHSEQITAHGISFFWNYFRKKDFRFKIESKAYAVQVIAGADLNGCANSLANEYDLDINFYEAKNSIVIDIAGIMGA